MDKRLKTTLGGIALENPVLPGSGPHTGDLERMLFLANEQKVGAVVTKTIAPEAAKVQRPCIVSGANAIMNCELWSEYDAARWVEDFLPGYRCGSKTPVLASVGYSPEDLKKLIPQLDPFVDGYELNPRYSSLDFAPIGEFVAIARQMTKKPFWVKMNGASFAKPVEYAEICMKNGALGVTAATAIGPNMVIDLKKRGPVIGTAGGGYVWTSGPAIKPYALAMIHMIKSGIPEISIIGTGGVGSAEDVVEYLLAGADAVQMLSIAMLKGRDMYGKVISGLTGVLDRYGFADVDEVKNTAMVLPQEKLTPSFPRVDAGKCKRCGICIRNCPYFAFGETEDKLPVVDTNKCFGCGLCQSLCPSNAIEGVL
ncbi:MAG: 4Fe-4S binding protein [Bacillota bacterium]